MALSLKSIMPARNGDIIVNSDRYTNLIRYNRLKLLFSRVLFLTGAFLLVLDIYFIFNIKYWELNILWANFLLGCMFVILSFSSKLRRMFLSFRKKENPYMRKGECKECGTCCRLPIPCLFFYGGRCLIHKRRPKQCREFPDGPGQLVSHKCGYYFEKK